LTAGKEKGSELSADMSADKTAAETGAAAHVSNPAQGLAGHSSSLRAKHHRAMRLAPPRA
jgi:hypothetical protein